jgi:Ran GTPase-activating protein (RanGAP) involved in mRNA processing and transport
MGCIEEILTQLDNNDDSLTSLQCCGNDIDDKDIESIVVAMLLHNPNTVTELNLMSNNISNTGAKNIARLLTQNNSSLMKLNLQKNLIFDDGAIKLAEALTVNQTLQELYVNTREDYDENLGDLTAEAFAKMLLVNQTLRTLVIGILLITHVGICSIANALQLNRSCENYVASASYAK